MTETMYPTDRKVLAELQKHKGFHSAVPANVLAERMDISLRFLRVIINRLIFKHLQAIGSSLERNSAGYYLITNKKEEIYQRNMFNARARTTLKKAALANKSSLLETAADLIVSGLKDGERVEGVDRVLVKILKLLISDPQKYVQEIKVLNRVAKPLLVERGQVEALGEMAAKMQQLAKGIL